MSHFSVLVIGEDIEKQLAPFEEDIENLSKELLEYVDIEEEYRDKYENEKILEFYCNSNSSWGQEVSKENYKILKKGKLNYIFELEVKKQISDYFTKGLCYKCYPSGTKKYPKNHIWINVEDIIETTHPDKDVCFNGKIKVKIISSPKKISLKEEYPQGFETFMKEWASYEKDENGKYGYWTNPNAKWDWYQIGGRWIGMLKLKKEKTGTMGERSWVNETLHIDKDCCDSAKKGDIDLSVDEDKYKKALRFWELKIEGQEPKNEEEKELLNSNYYKKEYYTKKYKNKEYYAKLSTTFYTYAIVKNGKWYAKGDMGWFGCSSASIKDEIKWEENFVTELNKILDDTKLTIIDCHI